MFDFDNFREIWGTIRKNKLRTILTGFSVAWGIFMLIILLGSGNGLKNGTLSNFRNYATNRILIWPRWATKPHKGMQTSRKINFRNDEPEFIKQENPEIDLLTRVNSRNDIISYKSDYNTYKIQGVDPQKCLIDNINILVGDGRFINDIDNLQKRKVIVISSKMKETLFRDRNPLGKYVNIGTIPFQVIGVYTIENNNYDIPAYIPFRTSQTLYHGGYGMDEIIFTVNGINTADEFNILRRRLRKQMAQRHNFDSTDHRAIGLWSTLESYILINGVANGITFFIWIIGIGSLTAGIVSVSNIMLITVRERTREFGIRKSLGATPLSILKLVVIESIIITSIFGYAGMIGGLGLTELFNLIIEASNSQARGNNEINLYLFLDPTVGLNIALSATILIIIAGVLAGYFPARKAVKITAIEAMRHE